MAKDRAIEDKLKEMEKRVICGLLASIGALMTACMGDGGNSINYHRVGVIRENPMRCIYTTDDKGNIYVVSSADFEQRTELKDGDCCEVDFKTNFKDELASGVYDADIFNYDSVAYASDIDRYLKDIGQRTCCLFKYSEEYLFRRSLLFADAACYPSSGSKRYFRSLIQSGAKGGSR